MTHTSPPAEHPSPEIPDHPSDTLVDLIVSFLAPMFLFGGNTDIGLARLAAMETLNAYRLETQADLIAVAQIVAFGLGALASLSHSMEDGVSVSMALRLRGNANACNRSAEQNRRALNTHRPPPRPAETRAPVAPPHTPAEATGPAHVALSPPRITLSAQPKPAPAAASAYPDQVIDAALIALLRGTRPENPPPPIPGHYPPPPEIRPPAP